MKRSLLDDVSSYCEGSSTALYSTEHSHGQSKFGSPQSGERAPAARLRLPNVNLSNALIAELADERKKAAKTAQTAGGRD